MVQATQVITRIPLSEIFSDDEFNCRGFITQPSVAELAQDIARIGLLAPILVQPWNKSKGHKWRIICGHRRFLAVQCNNNKKLPNSDAINCIIYDHLTETQAYILNLSENIKRENLNIYKEAMAMKRFWDLGWSEEEIARELKVVKPWVHVRMALLRLPPEIQKRAEAEMLTQYQILEIAKLSTKAEQIEATKLCVDWKLKGNRGSLKLKGEKKALKEKNIFEAGKARDRADIGKMQDSVQNCLGNSHIVARTLGWAAGFVTTADYAKDIQNIAGNKRFLIPGEE